MRKINVKEKIIITVVVAVVVFLLAVFNVPCVFRVVFGIECIGCGMTRAVSAALRLDFTAALAHHRMVWSLPLLYAYFWFDGILLGRFTRFRYTDIIVLGLIAVGFVLNWVL